MYIWNVPMGLFIFFNAYPPTNELVGYDVLPWLRHLITNGTCLLDRSNVVSKWRDLLLKGIGLE